MVKREHLNFFFHHYNLLVLCCIKRKKKKKQKKINTQLEIYMCVSVSERERVDDFVIKIFFPFPKFNRIKYTRNVIYL